MFNTSKYTNWYFRLINSRQSLNRNKKTEYYESHHIIPRCLKGTNFKQNLILLTAREHYIAHLLLTKMCDEKVNQDKMIKAWHIINRKTKRVTNSKMFEDLRQRYSEACRNYRLGKKASNETKLKISKNHKNVSGKNNPNYGKRHSESTIQKIRFKTRDMNGSNNHMFGITHSESTKAFLSHHGRNKWNKENRFKLKQARSIGRLHTPWGVFISAKDAVNHPQSIYKDSSTILRQCRKAIKPGFWVENP